MAAVSLSKRIVCIKGAGEMASGVACRLHAANLKRIVMLETAQPLAVRRRVSFCEAVHQTTQTVEAVTARIATGSKEIEICWQQGLIAVCIDPHWQTLKELPCDIVIDAILAKKNLGTNKEDASLVIGLGPGFTAGQDVHCVIETHRGHHLGRVIYQGSAQPNTGIPGEIGSYTSERVLRAPAAGKFRAFKAIGEMVLTGEPVGEVNGHRVVTRIDGVVRGLIRDHTVVTTGLKVGDIDPRGEPSYCNSVSEKSRTIGGAVLEAILARFVS
jgi:xanthine dehydrogenase accessory factor